MSRGSVGFVIITVGALHANLQTRAQAGRAHAGGRYNISAVQIMKANIELDAGAKTFASGLLPELMAALRRSRPGDLVAITGEAGIGAELETWCRFTVTPLISTRRSL